MGQVPEWTKCTSREKRKEKVEKPFYSDSEGESGPTESADSGETVGSRALVKFLKVKDTQDRNVVSAANKKETHSKQRHFIRKV